MRISKVRFKANKAKWILLFVITAVVISVLLTSCSALKKNNYPDTVISNVEEEFNQGKIYICVKGIPKGNIPIKSIELKVNDGNWHTKQSSVATFTIDVYEDNLNNGTNTFYAVSKNASGNTDPSPASTNVYTWFPIIKANQLVTDEGSSLEARVNVYDKQYPTSELTITATSDEFNIDNTTKNGSWIVYYLIPKEDNFNGSAHLYIAAKAPDGLKTATDLKIKVNPMTDLDIALKNMVIEHPVGNNATVTGHYWDVGSNQLVRIYSVPVKSVGSKVITVNPSASHLVYSGYADSNGKLHIKVKPESLEDALYRIVDTGINRQGKHVSYKSKLWVNGSSDQSVTLVTTDYYNWFRDYFTNVTRQFTSFKFNDGTISWPRDLERHPPIYILTGGPVSSEPSSRVMNDVKKYVKLLYPNSKVTITATGDVANDENAWDGKILIFFDPNILTVNNALSGFSFDLYKDTNTIRDACVTLSTKYPFGNNTILGALGKEMTQTYEVGTVLVSQQPFSILNPLVGMLTEPSPLDWAGIDLIKMLTKYYGDGITGAVYSIGEYSFNELQGYYNNKVAVPDQSNIHKEYYVEPQDEPNE